MVKQGRAAKILIYDIETTPIIMAAWGVFEANALWLVEDWYILCFAYRWAHETTTRTVALPDFPLYKKEPKNDYEVARRLWELFDEADIIVAHNGDHFDQKKVNARLSQHGLGPPSPYRQVDTLKASKRYFKFTSNRLDALGETFRFGRKIDTGGAGLWRDCMEGNETSWKKMVRYCKRDVILLYKLYLQLRPWMTTHPSVHHHDEACPKCGSKNLQRRGYYHNATRTYSYQKFRCNDCGGWGRYRVSEKDHDRPRVVNAN